MIAYRISRPQLEALINNPGWLTRAKDRTREFKKLGRYEEDSSIWSEVKPVYMQLQGGAKCAYCERKLEGVERGTSEQDVEHFRPKGRVTAWKPRKALIDDGLAVAPIPALPHGYYLLPYALLNYSAACKPCNSALKRDRFPIAGSYNLKGTSPRALAREKPFLIYPIGDFDDDPEDLIGFNGVSPFAKAKKGHKRWRALVTIEFFNLDHQQRKNLFRERAMIIQAMCPQLEKLANAATSAAERVIAQTLINRYTSPTAPHTNCAWSFRALFDRDPVQARDVFTSTVTLMDRWS